MITWNDLTTSTGSPAVLTSRVRRLLNQATAFCGEDLAPLHHYISEAQVQRMTLAEGLEFAVERLHSAASTQRAFIGVSSSFDKVRSPPKQD